MNGFTVQFGCLFRSHCYVSNVHQPETSRDGGRKRNAFLDECQRCWAGYIFPLSSWCTSWKEKKRIFKISSKLGFLMLGKYPSRSAIGSWLWDNERKPQVFTWELKLFVTMKSYLWCYIVIVEWEHRRNTDWSCLCWLLVELVTLGWSVYGTYVAEALWSRWVRRPRSFQAPLLLVRTVSVGPKWKSTNLRH